MRRTTIACLFLASLAEAQIAGWSIPTNAEGDTLIDGRHYHRITSDQLIAPIHQGRALHLEGVAVVGDLTIARWADTLRAPIHLVDVHLESELDLQNMTVTAPLEVRRSTLAGGLRAQQTRFHSRVDLSETRFRRHVVLKSAVFTDSARFHNAQFDGILSLIGARFDGNASFHGTTFSDGAYFEDARFSSVSFEDAIFESVASFRRTRFTGATRFDAARFYSESWFWNSVFTAPTSFDGIKVIADISFREIVAEREISFVKSSFVYPASFTGADFRAGCTFEAARFKRHADLSKANFRGGVRLHSAFWRDLDLRGTRGRIELQPPPPVAPGSPAEPVLTDSSRILLQGASAEVLRTRWAYLQGRLAADDSGEAGMDEVYASLVSQFRAQGLDADAAACALHGLERRASALPWTRPGRWTHEFLWLTTGFGRQPERLVIWSLAVIALFATFLRFRDGFSWSGAVRRSAVCFLRFHPLGVSESTGSRGLLLLECLLGWITMALVAAVVAVRMIL
ncbi:MAG: pentapeptide repeat-containing protein [Candidatus Latescibacterota bacterium]|nr:pentapeptide repeat-containing protein [Candidatus Latescibacterota bacterium]